MPKVAKAAVRGRAKQSESRGEPRPMPQTKKGRMRRDILKAATAELLKEYSYHDLTLERITSKADIPLSVFYHYFNTKKELVLELIEEVFVEFASTVTAYAPHGTWERGIRREQLALLTLFSANVGLMRCLYEVEDTEFSQRWRLKITDWHTRMAIGLREFAGDETPNDDELFAIVRALGGMANEFAYQLIVARDERLNRTFPDLESAADFLNALWIRTLFLQHPTRLSDQFTTLQGLHDFDTQAQRRERRPAVAKATVPSKGRAAKPTKKVVRPQE